ncbi:MAG: hypothetical protein IJX38_02305 [Clostridia bacterium]|nr:hypothetical protein [Clostridia bacterium]MBQ8371761.1 hypothetical protein [Clostridia bacterium]
MENTVKNEFEVKTLLKVLVRFWAIILALTVVLGAVGFAYTSLTNRTVYVGKATFWVKTGDGYAQTGEAAQLAANYTELARTDALCRLAVKMDDLVAEWGVNDEDAAVSRLRSMMSADKSDEDSLSFTVYVRSYDQNETLTGTRAIQQAMLYLIAEINGVDIGSNPENLPESSGNDYVLLMDQVRSSHDISATGTRSVLKYTVFGAAIGFVIGYAIAFILYMFKKKAYDEQTVEDEIAHVLATVPECIAEASSDGEVGAALSHEVEEAFNVLRHGVFSNASVSAVWVTSATTEYSSQFVGYNLAAAVARSGKSVLYIHFDSAGGEDVKPSAVSEITNMKSLALSYEGDYVSSSAIAAVVAEGRAEYDAVILASSAPERVRDVSLAVSALDGVVVAVSRNQDVSAARRNMELLGSVGANVYGACFVK